jgi:hypothetical protein
VDGEHEVGALEVDGVEAGLVGERLVEHRPHGAVADDDLALEEFDESAHVGVLGSAGFYRPSEAGA